MINITPTALQEIERIQTSRGEPTAKALKLGIKKGGCAGLFYNLKLEDSDRPSNTQDRLLEIGGIKIIIDAESWQYMENLKLDYSEDLMGGGFRFHNPQAAEVCGCGISFAAKKKE